MFDENVSADQIIAPGSTICVGAKFAGEKKVHLFTEWGDGYQSMLDQTHALMSEADAIVTYNGDKFDLPTLNGEFALAGMGPPTPTASIDVYKSVRKLRLGIHRLGYVGTRFGIGDKMKHEGFSLWTAVMAGDEKAQKRMERYCAQDVRLLEALYNKVLPFIRNHPHLRGRAGACPACGSTKVQSRGWQHNRATKVQRLHCQDCGSWHQGRRTKV